MYSASLNKRETLPPLPFYLSFALFKFFDFFTFLRTLSSGVPVEYSSFAFVLVLLEDLRGLFDELTLFDSTFRVIYFIL
jgi:hypothetical protein